MTQLMPESQSELVIDHDFEGFDLDKPVRANVGDERKTATQIIYENHLANPNNVLTL